MATCIQSIQAVLGDLDQVQELFTNTSTPFLISQTKNALVRIRIPNFQTVRLSVRLQPTTSVTAVNVSFTAFKIDGAAVSDIGGITITELNSFFTKDFPIGDYIICIRTNNLSAYEGTLIGEFTGYPTTARFTFTISEGASGQLAFEDKRGPRPCNEAMFFEIIEGSLPPGLWMNDLGKINGQLPNLDCIDPEDQFSPSQNWYYEQDGVYHPWGRQWRFKVKVYLQEYPESFAEEWFCIRVHNNWSLDRDNFLSQVPFDNVQTVEIIEPIKKLPQSICIEPCKEDPPTFVPTPLEEICKPCADPDVHTNIALIPIPEQLAKVPPSQFVFWYQRNKDRDLSNECPEVQKFMKDLRDSELFQKLLVQNNLLPKTDTQVDFLVASQFQNFLQLISTTQIDGRNPTDLDYMMLQWRDEENQKLPITILAVAGDKFQVELT